MLDTGGMMCILSERCLPTDGRWYTKDISHNSLRVSGVFEGVHNVSSKWIQARLEPIEGKNLTELRNVFIDVDFYIMNDENYPKVKRGLPRALLDKLNNLEIKFEFADPVILEPGNRVINCDGIIGNSHQNAFMLECIHPLSDRLVRLEIFCLGLLILLRVKTERFLPASNIMRLPIKNSTA
jgi:hypothetical protein